MGNAIDNSAANGDVINSFVGAILKVAEEIESKESGAKMGRSTSLGRSKYKVDIDNIKVEMIQG